MKKTCITHNLLTGEAIKIKLTTNKYFQHTDETLYLKAAYILLTLCKNNHQTSGQQCELYQKLNEDLKVMIKQLN
ncbi:hypothetical protein [Companilactobacillus kedongensis]|uniref:hypothetical protein n=1 Tax=Companilactobacillus kedongensis TaxID=2486004 RepID=UPI000F76692D|nr:hypothetical protein [Companilactobacillus kedongensis]